MTPKIFLLYQQKGALKYKQLHLSLTSTTKTLNDQSNQSADCKTFYMVEKVCNWVLPPKCSTCCSPDLRKHKCCVCKSASTATTLVFALKIPLDDFVTILPARNQYWCSMHANRSRLTRLDSEDVPSWRVPQRSTAQRWTPMLIPDH
jgi:hypothetical protein